MPRLLLSVVLASVAVAAQAPRGIPVMLLDGGSVVLGLQHTAFEAHPDARVYGHHARVSLTGDLFVVNDRGSRNGTDADGVTLAADEPCQASRVIRVGD